MLQFDVVSHRLQHEYGVDCVYEPTPIQVARWVRCDDKKRLQEFTQTEGHNLARDAAERLCYLAPNHVNLQLTQERWPEIEFFDSCEILA